MLKVNAMVLAAAFGMVALAPQTAAADARIFPYATHDNHCPEGLRPVVFNGLISCGTPNTDVTYQSVIAHPVAKKTHQRKTHRPSQSCRIGTKGCTFD